MTDPRKGRAAIEQGTKYAPSSRIRWTGLGSVKPRLRQALQVLAVIAFVLMVYIAGVLDGRDQAKIVETGDITVDELRFVIGDDEFRCEFEGEKVFCQPYK